MNCSNCGANMLHITGSDHFKCEYCESWYFPTPTDEGVRVFEETKAELNCPICQIKLHKATILKADLLCCITCKGLLMKRKKLAYILQVERTHPSRKISTVQPLNQKEFKRKINCPKCKCKMETHPYLGPGNIVLDSCSQCHKIWLDYGELIKAIQAP